MLMTHDCSVALITPVPFCHSCVCKAMAHELPCTVSLLRHVADTLHAVARACDPLVSEPVRAAPVKNNAQRLALLMQVLFVADIVDTVAHGCTLLILPVFPSSLAQSRTRKVEIPQKDDAA